MKITIFGDICPTLDTQDAFNRGDIEAIFGDVLDEIKSSDIVIGNLESAVTDNPIPIKKAGPVLYTSTKSIESLRYFNAISLANNHIRDCGDDGVLTAIESCKINKIQTFGAGRTLSDAKSPIIIEIEGKKVGFMAFAEHEFNLATSERPGACDLDVYNDFDRIREFRKTVDCLIIIYHGGIEYYPYASPELSKKCRKFVDCGADLVTCQHSHCIGTVEKYKNSTIVYGLGNSVFGFREGNHIWNQGLLIQIIIDGDNISVMYKGITATSNGIRLMTEEEQKQLCREIDERSAMSEVELSREWDKFCYNHALIHIPLLLGWPRLLIFLNRVTNNSIVRLLYSRKKYNNTHNLIRCESLYEVIKSSLSKKDFE